MNLEFQQDLLDPAAGLVIIYVILLPLSLFFSVLKTETVKLYILYIR